MRRAPVRNAGLRPYRAGLILSRLMLLLAAGVLLAAGCSPPATPPPEPVLPDAAAPASSSAPPAEAAPPSSPPDEPAAETAGPSPPPEPAAEVAVPQADTTGGLPSSIPETGDVASPESSFPEDPDTLSDSPAGDTAGGGQAPETPAGENVADGPAGKPPSPLTLDALLRISEGMTYEEIRTILGEPGVRVAGSGESGEIYRWNAGGLSFTARIENGRLVRKRLLEDGRPVRGPNRPPEKSLDRALYDAIREGMTYEQVLAILGMEPQPVLRPDSDVVVYRWSDPSGASFTARFENGVLVRKNGLYMLPRRSADEVPSSAMEKPPESSPDTTGENKAEEPVPGTGDINSALPAANARPFPDNAPDGSVPPSSPGTDRSDAAGDNADNTSADITEDMGTAPPSVSEPDDSDRKASRQRIRRASLPRFAHRLRSGAYEIRVNNLSDSDVEAALLSDTGGLRLNLRAGQSQSVRVPEGNYVLYFIYDKEPETLNRGGVIPVSEWRADVDLYLIGESYDIRALERSGEPPSRGRRR